MVMTKENGFQAELIAEIIKQGGHAYKTSNMYTTGVPDISMDVGGIVGRPYTHIKMECKLMKPSTTTRQITIQLSVPQEHHLNRTERAKGLAVWVVGYNFKDAQRWGLFVLHSSLGRKHTFKAPDFQDFSHPSHFTKQRGKPWPIKNICKMILNAENLDRRHLYANWPG